MKKILLLMFALLVVGGAKVNAKEVKIPIELTGTVAGVTVTPIDPTTLEPLATAPEHVYAAKFTTSNELQNIIQMKNMSTADAVAQGCDRIVIEFGSAVGDAWRFHSYGGQFDNIEEIGGETEHTLMLDGDKAIDDFTIFNWVGSGAQELIIKAAYFYKPSDTKTLEVNLSALPASSENTTWDSSTGTFAWSGTSYNSTQLFGSGNYTAYTTLNLTTAKGTADHFRIIIKFTNGASQVTINPVAVGSVSLTLANYVAKLSDLASVESIRLSGANDVIGDIKVTEVYLEGPNVTYIEASEVFEAPAGTTDVKNLIGTEGNWANTVVYPKEFAVQGQAFGNGDGSSESTHVNIEGYDYICFNVTEATSNTAGLRVWIWDGEAGGTGSVKTLYAYPIDKYATATWTEATKITGAGTYVAKVSGYKYLKGVKAANDWGSSAAKVSMAYMCTGNPVAYLPSGKYALVGEATGSVSLTEALADASATVYDATGVTSTGVELTPANPNALFIANDGVLANANNVIVNGTCANLVLTDGNPFKAPADFTATAASYNTTISTAAQVGTLCLPFAAAIPEGVTAYTLEYTSGDAATATPVETTIPANTPVLLNGSGAAAFTGANVAVDADASNVEGAMTGVFAATQVPDGSYVLQNGDEGIGFYKVEPTAAIFANPFRAYLTAQAAGANVRINYAEVTGIAGTEAPAAKRGAIYTVAGQRVAKPAKGFYIQDGKTYYAK